MSDEMKELKKKLLTTKKNGYDIVSGETMMAVEAYCEGYKAFLDAGRRSAFALPRSSAWRPKRVTVPMSGAWR